MRLAADLLLSVIQAGLDWVQNAKHRVAVRRYLEDNPSVTLYYPDGEQAPPPPT